MSSYLKNNGDFKAVCDYKKCPWMVSVPKVAGENKYCSDTDLLIINTQGPNEVPLQKTPQRQNIDEGSAVPIQRREELIHNVIHKGKSITYAAKKLRIKYSTARIIITKFR
jgi:hypothetical protein